LLTLQTENRVADRLSGAGLQTLQLAYAKGRIRFNISLFSLHLAKFLRAHTSCIVCRFVEPTICPESRALLPLRLLGAIPHARRTEMAVR
jgi:hypothetical protein